MNLLTEKQQQYKNTALVTSSEQGKKEDSKAFQDWRISKTLFCSLSSQLLITPLTVNGTSLVSSFHHFQIPTFSGKTIKIFVQLLIMISIEVILIKISVRNILLEEKNERIFRRERGKIFWKKRARISREIVPSEKTPSVFLAPELKLRREKYSRHSE